MKKIFTFNTGRQYSDKGQRIAAVVLDDGRVMFADVDRMIDGITDNPITPARAANSTILQRFIMEEYDYGRIKYGYYEFGDFVEGAALMQQLRDAANAI